MSIARTVLFLLPFLLAAPATNAAAIVIGQPCDQLGATAMTTDQKTIAACLKDDSGKTIWKSTTSSTAPNGSICGMASLYVHSLQNNVPVGNCGETNYAACQGKNIATCARVGASYKLSIQCPNGYKAIVLRDVVDFDQNPGDGPGPANPRQIAYCAAL